MFHLGYGLSSASMNSWKPATELIQVMGTGPKESVVVVLASELAAAIAAPSLVMTLGYPSLELLHLPQLLRFLGTFDANPEDLSRERNKASFVHLLQ